MPSAREPDTIADADAHGDFLTVADCEPDTCTNRFAFPCPDCDAHLHPNLSTNAYPKPKPDSYPIADTAPDSAAERY